MGQSDLRAPRLHTENVHEAALLALVSTNLAM